MKIVVSKIGEIALTLNSGESLHVLDALIIATSSSARNDAAYAARSMAAMAGELTRARGMAARIHEKRRKVAKELAMEAQR